MSFFLLSWIKRLVKSHFLIHKMTLVFQEEDMREILKGEQNNQFIMVSASQSSIEYVVICDRSALQYCIYPFKSMFFFTAISFLCLPRTNMTKYLMFIAIGFFISESSAGKDKLNLV